MGILMKYTFRSIGEKKMRTLLIVVAITLSVALTFASFALKDSITDTFKEMIKKYLGSANILITATKDSPMQFVPIVPLEDPDRLIDYQIGSIETQGFYAIDSKQEQRFVIRGYSDEDIAQLGVVKMIERLDGPFTGKSIYISKAIAEKYGWHLGDTIDLKFNNLRHKITIHGIGADSGALSKEGKSAYAILPIKTLQQMEGTQGRYHFILAKSADGVSFEQAQQLLNDHYPRYKVDEPIPWEIISQQLNSITVPFLFMLMLVLVTSIFIIYTAFKVIASEKLPVLGTFRSIGATKFHANTILLLESAIYGVIGSILGLMLGELILNLMGNLTAQGIMQAGDVKAQTSAAPIYYIASGLFGVVLAILSAALPILQIAKIPVRDIVLGSFTQVDQSKKIPALLGLLMMAFAIFFPIDMFETSKGLLIGLGTLFAFVGLVLLVTPLTNLFLHLLSIPTKSVFRNTGQLALLNIRGNKSILNNISLLTIGISGILLINTISYSINIEVLKVYRQAKYDVTVYANQLDRSDMQSIAGTEGVVGAMGIYTIGNTKIDAINGQTPTKQSTSIGSISGISGSEYFDYWQFPWQEGELSNLDRNFALDRALVLTDTLKQRFNLKLGDEITLKFSEDISRTYTVVGFINAIMNNGNFALASGAQLKRDAQLSAYSEIMIKSTQPEVTKEKMTKRFEHDAPYIVTMSEMEKTNNEANAAIIIGLQSFSFLAMAIGLFGIFNNFIVSLMSRQRSISIMKSVGMSRAQTLNLLLLEALLSGLIGGIMSIFGTLVLLVQIERLLGLLNLPIAMHLDMNLFAIGLACGGIVSMIANWLPALKSSKMSIVQGIKFE